MKSYDDVYKTPGAFSWSELITSDPEAASKFYSQLFAWQIEAGDTGGQPYNHIKVGETSIGGASWANRRARRQTCRRCGAAM